MLAKSPSVCFVIDSPINAFIASLIGRQFKAVHIIYCWDPVCKNIDEYRLVSKSLLHDLNVVSEHVIEIDSVCFWNGDKSRLLSSARQALLPLIGDYPKATVYFGNCFTNPVALALKKLTNLVHLYHGPSDFATILFPNSHPSLLALKYFVKKILGRETYQIDNPHYPIYSLLNFPSNNRFQFLNFYDFHSSSVEDVLAPLSRMLNGPDVNVMLLLAADEPEPGDNNLSNICKYLQPHYQSVDALVKADKLDNFVLWLKEHRSYQPLSVEERSLLQGEFSKLGCEVKFVSDYLPIQYRSLPGECILKYGNVHYIIAEPSSFLFNVAGSSTIPIAVVSFFEPYRNNSQISRNAELIAINELLAHPVRVY